MAKPVAADAASHERAMALRERLLSGDDWLALELEDAGGEMPRIDTWTAEERRGIFLRTLAETYNVSAACDAALISRQTAYNWREQDGRFGKLWDIALTRAVERVEGVMYGKAVAGEVVPGIVMLKAMKPLQYRDNAPIPQPMSERRTLRFLTDEERDSVIEAEYRSVPQLPASTGDGE